MLNNEKRAHALALIATEKMVELTPDMGVEEAALKCYNIYSEAYDRALFILNTKFGTEAEIK